ncbi:hypothetical protein CQA53_02330 [Helicobacter didelphidarum]|uniref:Uncharacterized protein n=1 Tax=Helicobacter didelphidarum TaxID=2040648 RepID=A0A3D8IQ49_9HELI|nr:hypothetical protein [Helicobacter didelphidarum]RDU67110.1 hypothetical protein CQA53_02330 [Helicobacter didelphidarum]
MKKLKLFLLLAILICSCLIVYLVVIIWQQNTRIQPSFTTNKKILTTNQTLDELSDDNLISHIQDLNEIATTWNLLRINGVGIINNTQDNLQNNREQSFIIAKNGMIQNNTINDNSQGQEIKNSRIIDIQKMKNFYRIYTIKDLAHTAQTSTTNPQSLNTQIPNNIILEYRFSWIDKENGLANINGECFIDNVKMQDYLRKIVEQNDATNNHSNPFVPTIYPLGSSQQTGQYEIAKYTRSTIKNLISTNKIPNHAHDFVPLTLRIRNSSLFVEENREKNIQEKSFPHTFIIDGIKINQESQSPNKRLVMIATLKDVPNLDNPQIMQQDSFAKDSNSQIRTQQNSSSSLTQIDYNLFSYDNIQSLWLYILHEDNSIDIANGLDITPLQMPDNPCVPHDFIKNNFFVYENGEIYIQTESYKQNIYNFLTKHFIITDEELVQENMQKNISKFTLKESFLNEDCTKEGECEVSLQKRTYIPQCQNLCVLLPQWHIEKPLNESQKQLYLNRFKIKQSILAQNTQENSNSNITLEIFNDTLGQYQWVGFDKQAEITPSSLINLAESTSSAHATLQENISKDSGNISLPINIAILYTKGKKPIKIDITQTNALSLFNEYFESKIFSNAFLPRTLTQNAQCPNHTECAYFIPHSSLESVQGYREDVQNFLILQNIFLEERIPFIEVEEYTKELIFQKVGFFGREKKIKCIENLGNLILYKEGKSFQILEKENFNEEKIKKYFRK